MLFWLFSAVNGGTRVRGRAAVRSRRLADKSAKHGRATGVAGQLSSRWGRPNGNEIWIGCLGDHNCQATDIRPKHSSSFAGFRWACPNGTDNCQATDIRPKHSSSFRRFPLGLPQRDHNCQATDRSVRPGRRLPLPITARFRGPAPTGRQLPSYRRRPDLRSRRAGSGDPRTASSTSLEQRFIQRYWGLPRDDCRGKWPGTCPAMADKPTDLQIHKRCHRQRIGGS